LFASYVYATSYVSSGKREAPSAARSKEIWWQIESSPLSVRLRRAVEYALAVDRPISRNLRYPVTHLVPELQEITALGHAVAYSLRHYARSQKVAGSRPYEVTDVLSVYLILPAATRPWGLLSL
jgi:hypothetical protein